MNLKKCPICHNKKLGTMLDKYQQCKSCKTAWIIKNPKATYSKKYYEPKFSLVGLVFKPIEFILYKIRNLYCGTSNKKIWVDVGAGEGRYLRSVTAKRKIGVEVSNAGRVLMQKAGIETLSEQEFLKAHNLRADVVSFWHVLEHIEKPWEYLRAAARNLSRDGKIVIGVPNIESLDFKVFKDFWFHLAPKHHLWHFSKRGLEILFDSKNLQISFVDYFSPEHNLVGVLQSFINRSSNSYNLLHSIVKRNVYTSKITFKDVFWITFWMSLGFPIVIMFWLAAVFAKKSGTMVFVLKKK